MDSADKISRAYRAEIQTTLMNSREDDKTDIAADMFES